MISDLKESIPASTVENSSPSNIHSPLVDFMIIGAQKCGTTTLANQLAEHPDVCFCRIKEPGYFNEQHEWQSELSSYHELYAPTAGQICGEASTMYTFFPEYQGTHERLYTYNPQLKLIYIMRNPIERVASLYAHNVVRGIEKRGPEVAVLEDPTYVNRSRYGMQLEPYLKLFSGNQILPLIFEEYVTDQTAVLDGVAQFLGISKVGFDTSKDSHNHKTVGTPYLKYEFVRHITGSEFFQTWRLLVPEKLRHSVRGLVSNTLTEKPEFPDSLKSTLRQMLSADIDAIESLIGRPISAWR